MLQLITPSSRESCDSTLESLHSKPEIFVICKAKLYWQLSHLQQRPVFTFFCLFRRSLDTSELGCLPPALCRFRNFSDLTACEIVLAWTAPMSLMSVCSSVDLSLLSPQACLSLVRASTGRGTSSLCINSCSRGFLSASWRWREDANAWLIVPCPALVVVSVTLQQTLAISSGCLKTSDIGSKILGQSLGWIRFWNNFMLQILFFSKGWSSFDKILESSLPLRLDWSATSFLVIWVLIFFILVSRDWIWSFKSSVWLCLLIFPVASNATENSRKTQEFIFKSGW
jgi:hypothetical protein